MPEISEVLDAYGKAWLEQDDDKRAALLEYCWVEDGIYQDPNANVKGREALCKHIGNQHANQPGSKVEITSGFNHHHGKIQFNWRFVNSQGEVKINGVDFGTLNEDGKLCQIIGFFGPPPPLNE